MKNSEIICKGLILSIIILLFITFGYYLSKSNDIMDNNNNGSSDAVENDSLNNHNGHDSNKGDDLPVFVPQPGTYRQISTLSEFESLINRDDGAFYVLGRKGCHFCELYVPVLKDITNNYNIEINYIDLASLTSDDYYGILNTSLMIPAKCHKTGKEVELKEGFGTPLGLFIKESATYDCIRGYKDKESLIKTLKEIKYIE